MRIRLHIDRVVLEGLDVPYGSRRALHEGLARDLARRLAEGGLASWAAAGGAVPSLPGSPIDTRGTPGQTGAAIAGSVYHAVGGRPQSPRPMP
jgi:hypothetical protein